MKLSRISSQSDIYKKLEERSKLAIQNIEEHFDVLAKFTKDESRKFLNRRRDGTNKYDSRIIKFIKDSHSKKHSKKLHVKNSQYLITADRFVSQL